MPTSHCTRNWRRNKIFVLFSLSAVCCLQIIADVRLCAGSDAQPHADGARILFQRDTPLGRRVGVRALATGEETWIDTRSGSATFPCWSPDGSIVYTWGNETNTAFAARGGSSGFNLWRWKDGARRQLTFGRERDYTPSVSLDGRTVYYSTTHGVEQDDVFKNTVALESVSIDGGDRRPFAHIKGASCGLVSPRLSPDGRFAVWAQIDRFFDTWHLMAARVDNPRATCTLTPKTFSAYSPAWCPDGEHLAFTGFQMGDPAWGVYIQHLASGALHRIASGRNPAFSADGRKLYYDQDGSIFVHDLTPEDFPQNTAEARARERARREAQEAETIHVRAKIVYQPAQGLSFVAVGATPLHPLTLQLFFRDTNTVEFATRYGSDLQYAHVSLKGVYVPGRSYTITGIRQGTALHLSVDDEMPSATAEFASLMPVREPDKVTRGRNFPGEIKDLRIQRGWPVEVPRPLTRDAFWKGGAE